MCDLLDPKCGSAAYLAQCLCLSSSSSALSIFFSVDVMIFVYNVHMRACADVFVCVDAYIVMSCDRVRATRPSSSQMIVDFSLASLFLHYFYLYSVSCIAAGLLRIAEQFIFERHT